MRTDGVFKHVLYFLQNGVGKDLEYGHCGCRWIKSLQKHQAPSQAVVSVAPLPPPSTLLFGWHTISDADVANIATNIPCLFRCRVNTESTYIVIPISVYEHIFFLPVGTLYTYLACNGSVSHNWEAFRVLALGYNPLCLWAVKETRSEHCASSIQPHSCYAHSMYEAW